MVCVKRGSVLLVNFDFRCGVEFFFSQFARLESSWFCVVSPIHPYDGHKALARQILRCISCNGRCLVQVPYHAGSVRPQDDIKIGLDIGIDVQKLGLKPTGAKQRHPRRAWLSVGRNESFSGSAVKREGENTPWALATEDVASPLRRCNDMIVDIKD